MSQKALDQKPVGKSGKKNAQDNGSKGHLRSVKIAHFVADHIATQIPKTHIETYAVTFVSNSKPEFVSIYKNTIALVKDQLVRPELNTEIGLFDYVLNANPNTHRHFVWYKKLVKARKDLNKAGLPSLKERLSFCLDKFDIKKDIVCAREFVDDLLTDCLFIVKAVKMIIADILDSGEYLMKNIGQGRYIKLSTIFLSLTGRIFVLLKQFLVDLDAVYQLLYKMRDYLPTYYGNYMLADTAGNNSSGRQIRQPMTPITLPSSINDYIDITKIYSKKITEDCPDVYLRKLHQLAVAGNIELANGEGGSNNNNNAADATNNSPTTPLVDRSMLYTRVDADAYKEHLKRDVVQVSTDTRKGKLEWLRKNIHHALPDNIAAVVAPALNNEGSQQHTKQEETPAMSSKPQKRKNAERKRSDSGSEAQTPPPTPSTAPTPEMPSTSKSSSSSSNNNNNNSDDDSKNSDANKSKEKTDTSSQTNKKRKRNDEPTPSLQQAQQTQQQLSKLTSLLITGLKQKTEEPAVGQKPSSEPASPPTSADSNSNKNKKKRSEKAADNTSIAAAAAAATEKQLPAFSSIFKIRTKDTTPVISPTSTNTPTSDSTSQKQQNNNNNNKKATTATSKKVPATIAATKNNNSSNSNLIDELFSQAKKRKNKNK